MPPFFQLFDKIQKGCVNWKKVNTPPFKALGGQMKQIENCNYAIDLGHNLGFVLVGKTNDSLVLFNIFKDFKNFIPPLCPMLDYSTSAL